MDFNNGLYVFNGVPGLDASKGERIVKALRKLQAKIKHLEQVRESERQTSTKGTQAGNDKDLTITDVQFKLLVLQLQYMRAILRKNRISFGSPYEPGNIIFESTLPKNAEKESDEIQNCCKETQTGMSLCESHFQTESPPHYIDSQHTKKKISASKYTEDTSQPTSSTKNVIRSVTSNSTANFSPDPLANEHVPVPSASSKDTRLHYHLKFGDIPFILGASSSASHNIVANFQNIIAMMKTHNKALCGSKSQTHRNCTTTASPTVRSSSQDTNKILKNLSEELTELRLKQAKLIERFDSAESGSNFINSGVKSIPCNSSESFTRQIKKFTGSDSTTNITATSVNPKGSKHFKPKREVAKKEKHAVPTNRLQANLPQVSRHRLLRSIQELKTHLSEEDITWD